MRPRRAGALSLAYAAVLAVAGSALLLLRRDDLRDPLALHWGASGPDRFATFGQALAVSVGLTLGLPAAIWLVSLALPRSQRSDLAAVGVGSATLVAVAGFGLTAAQGRGAQEPNPALWVIGAVVVALATGLTFGRWARPTQQAWSAGPGEVPADAPRLDVPSTTRLAWSGHARPGRVVTGVGALLVLLPAAALVLTDNALVAVVLIGPLLVLVVLTGGRVVVDREGVSIRTAGVITWVRVPIARVSSAQVGHVDALGDFGGWGFRMAPDGRRGLVTRSGPALVVHRTGQPDVVATVDDAEQAAAVLNTLLAR